MSSKTFQGLDDAFSRIAGLPAAARHELADVIGRLARDILAAQRARTPRETGALAEGLTSQLLTDELRAKIGLLTAGASRKLAQYYGRFVEFGVRAQTVIVQRRRRVNGKLRLSSRRKRAEDIVTTYSLPVRAQNARPFINVPDGDLDAMIERRLANFWPSAFERAENSS